MKEILELIDDLGKLDGLSRDEAADVLVHIGEPAVEPLIAALSDPRWEVRGGAANALARIGDDRAVGPLIDLLHDPLVGGRAAMALGLVADRRAIEPLNALLSDPFVREAARNAIEAIASRFPLKGSDGLSQLPTTEPITRQTALRRIVTNGIESVLLPADFAAVGKRLWVRSERELLHLIALGFRHGSYGIELGIVSPEATDFVWGHAAKKADFGDVVMHGTPSSIRWPAAWQSFRVDDKEDPEKIDETAREIAEGMKAVATWLGQFQTRLQLRSYLLEPKGGNGFIIPSPALKVYIAAVLAVLDRDPAAAHLAEEAEIAGRPWTDPLNMERMRRLKVAVAAMSEIPAEGTKVFEHS